MPALDLAEIDKVFGSIAALRGASLRVPSGTVHALLGENGAGKTTLMRIAFGSLAPDRGRILVNGRLRQFRSTRESRAAGIGMIHQLFSLVHTMTVAENVALGGSGRFRQREAIDTVERIAAETGLYVDPRSRVGELGVAGQQRVEILKALSHDARILILDEPTAVLPPVEAATLLAWIRNFAQGERSAVLVTHKVREALRIADDVTVLRNGRAVFSSTAATTDESELAREMVDQTPVAVRSQRVSADRPVVVALEGIECSTRERVGLQETSLVIRGGELLGVAGVEGSGYRDLLRVIAARLEPSRGRRSGPDDAAFIPEDRHREALALELPAAENIALRGSGRRHGTIDWQSMRNRTRELAIGYRVRGPLESPTRLLSGGNQQKLVVARELDGNPPLVVAENPT
ncbi:MAG TPA: ATP-binding cassette domain-containing protein, partial [Steroidobacteraceae bacterium]|nr:ATP-binding cassette domain-containing protein [Steroidobacteraceae bacterium]